MGKGDELDQQSVQSLSYTIKVPGARNVGEVRCHCFLGSTDGNALQQQDDGLWKQKRAMLTARMRLHLFWRAGELNVYSTGRRGVGEEGFRGEFFWRS